MARADLFHADRRVLAVRDISRGPIDASMFASLPIDVNGLMDPANGEPGADWNLSVTERALLRDVERDGEGGSGVAAAFRHILAERSAAYRSGGTRAIASYTRPGEVGVFAAGSEAAALWMSYVGLNAIAPGVHAAVAAYPRPVAPTLRHSFYASMVAFDQLPVTVLSHRAEASGSGYAIAVESEFYVSRTYGVRQTVLGAATLSGGKSVAFYLTAVAGAVPTARPLTGVVAPTGVTPLLAQLRSRFR